ncbi:MAG: PAAR domain-containing protein [Ignavibacteriaceae bacterium]|nr:PAAR domain-containing protein [Ignavibacterium sp.]MCC6255171.1 PAAR domain-containing protein [Ignavibacteriaceae bacterium]HRN25161.1 PAAR domain-containing protein [Ignavibacteriaceae bacterium]HRP92301.1 PAAR domain-containing protein [Ignavibacteriaceae bacterium]HRQ53359.1 PAAR domain-containing protein [Ignavibacteriaceae bacterium]
MGKPAARQGDPTAHGGVIMSGFPTVLIGGMPAARLTDMHTCPFVTPGTPPIPHVGGPITGPGVPTVLIGGMPAACVGDMAVCVGPPSTIIMGCPTVLIGPGGGGGGGGGAGSSGAGSATTSAKQALTDNVEATAKEKHWIEFEMVDKVGNAITGVHYKMKDTDNKESKAVIKSDGKIKRDGINEGQCEVVLVDLFGAEWSKEKAKVGDKVKLKVKSIGIDNGDKVEFRIFVKDINYSDHLLIKLEADISSDKAEIEWELKVDEDFIKIIEHKENIGRYSQPFFYFDAYCNEMVAKSGLLYYEDKAELVFKDEDGKVIADKEYKVYLPTGEIKKGKLDSNGKTKIEKLPPGKFKISFKP